MPELSKNDQIAFMNGLYDKLMGAHGAISPAEAKAMKAAVKEVCPSIQTMRFDSGKMILQMQGVR